MSNTTDPAAELAEALAKAKVVIDEKRGYQSMRITPSKGSRIVGFVTPQGSDMRVEHLMALIEIAEQLPAILAQHAAMKARIEALEGAFSALIKSTGEFLSTGSDAQGFAEMIRTMRIDLAKARQALGGDHER